MGTGPARFGTATSRQQPAPGVWSPLEYTVHTTAALDFYTDRIELALAHDRPRFTAFDFSVACDRDRYNEREPQDALAVLAQASERLKTVLESLTPAQWQRVGIGSGGAHEVQHHALDVRRQAFTI